jgi:hypothetical protein
MIRYFFYVLRWALFAIPGVFILEKIREILPSPYISMILSQILVGGLIGYWIDKLIFKIGDKKEKKVGK